MWCGSVDGRRRRAGERWWLVFGQGGAVPLILIAVRVVAIVFVNRGAILDLGAGERWPVLDVDRPRRATVDRLVKRRPRCAGGRWPRNSRVRTGECSDGRPPAARCGPAGRSSSHILLDRPMPQKNASGARGASPAKTEPLVLVLFGVILFGVGLLIVLRLNLALASTPHPIAAALDLQHLGLL